jgi:hypothetical protein
VGQFEQHIRSGRLRRGLTRNEVKALLGEPDAVGCTSRRYRTPSCYRYGDVQLFFGLRAADGLTMVFSEDENGEDGVVLPLPQCAYR